MKFIFHADDFGINEEQSLLILSCSEGCGGSGPLNSTSMLVGSPAAKECAEMIAPFVKAGRIRIGLHLNLVEGPCCAPAAEIPTLVDDRGMLSLGFAGMLAKTHIPGAAPLKRDIAQEIGAQLDRFLELFPEERDHLRVDSHQHFHLIPAVFDALLCALEERGCVLEYLRIPAEPVAPYRAIKENRKNYPPINYVKNRLLNALWSQDRAIVRKRLGCDADVFVRERSATFYGLMLSGRMEYAATPAMVAAFEDEAAKRDTATEILFHPGGIDDISQCLDPKLAGFTDFYLSPHRTLERESLRAIDFMPYVPLT